MEKLTLEDFNIEAVAKSAAMVDEFGNIHKSEKHIAVVRKDTNEILHYPTKTYKIIQNKDVIDSFLTKITPITNNIVLGQSHSFVKSEKMQVQLTFPDFQFNDGSSDVALTAYISNSYDGSSGVRVLWGGIRKICTNGMIWGINIEKFYAKHTQGASLFGVDKQFERIVNAIPEMKERIRILNQIEFKLPKDEDSREEMQEKFQKQYGKKASDYIMENYREGMAQYDLVNLLTWFISHKIDVARRSDYQLRVARNFKL